MLPGISPHTSRHSVGSNAASSGEPLSIGAILRHANLRFTAIYAHVDYDPARYAADRATDAIVGALARRSLADVAGIDLITIMHWGDGSRCAWSSAMRASALITCVSRSTSWTEAGSSRRETQSGGYALCPPVGRCPASLPGLRRPRSGLCSALEMQLQRRVGDEGHCRG